MTFLYNEIGDIVLPVKAVKNLNDVLEYINANHKNSYHVRIWQRDERTYFDYGSHHSFYFVKETYDNLLKGNV